MIGRGGDFGRYEIQSSNKPTSYAHRRSQDSILDPEHQASVQSKFSAQTGRRSQAPHGRRISQYLQPKLPTNFDHDHSQLYFLKDERLAPKTPLLHGKKSSMHHHSRAASTLLRFEVDTNSNTRIGGSHYKQDMGIAIEVKMANVIRQNESPKLQRRSTNQSKISRDKS